MRSAAPVRPTQPTRCLCCHLDSSCARNPFHQRIKLSKSAMVRSLVTFFGIKKNIVVQACCGHLPHCSDCSKNSTISPLVSFDKSSGTLGKIHHIPHPSLPCNSSLPLIDLLPSTSAALPPNFSSPHSTTACPSGVASPCCTASALPTLCCSPPTLSSSSSRTCTHPLQAAGFLILCSEPADQFIVYFLRPLSSSSPSSRATNLPSLHCCTLSSFHNKKSPRETDLVSKAVETQLCRVTLSCSVHH